MKVVTPTHDEIAFNQCYELLRLNPLIDSTYYSTLFLTFESLLNTKDIMRLRKMIFDIEEWVSDDLNIITLREIEIRMYNNMDLNSGFFSNGILKTQLDINERLQDVKSWLNVKLYQYMRLIRFTARVEI